MKEKLFYAGWIAVLVVFGIFSLTFERSKPETAQGGFRGLSMGQVVNPNRAEVIATRNMVPAAIEAADAGGQRASEVYTNVRVLGHLSVEQFGRIMQAMTDWVTPGEGPNQGCNGCHVEGDFAAEAPYQKIVSRRMLQMVQAINTNLDHFVTGGSGVTCYTCHRGNPVPTEVWANAPPNARLHRLASTAPEQNRPVAGIGFTSMPTDPYSAFLQRDNPIALQTQTGARAAGNTTSIQATEWTYSLMMSFSTGMGVNCTFCHNSRNFSGWADSTPQRVTAWHAIRMVRTINNDYIEPLRSVLPANRLGPLGDPLKVNCATCHQGQSRPLNGAPMLRDYPELNAPARRASLEGPAQN